MLLVTSIFKSVLLLHLMTPSLHPLERRPERNVKYVVCLVTNTLIALKMSRMENENPNENPNEKPNENQKIIFLIYKKTFIDFPLKPIKIDPYFIGLCIGNNNYDNEQIVFNVVNTHEEIYNYLSWTKFII